MFLSEDCDKFYRRMTADETFAGFKLQIENLALMITDRIATEHIRIVHSFETYFARCDRSVLKLYNTRETI